MTRVKFLFAALVAAAIVAAPAANAQTLHYVGAGSSAQWQEAALGTYSAIQSFPGVVVNGFGGSGQCTYHYTAKNNNADGNPAAVLIDPRSSSIPQEPGNIWLIWIGNCSNPLSNVTDIWTDITVDSTVGNRAFFAAHKIGTVSVQGVQLNIDSSNPTGGTNAIKNTLYSDSSSDQSYTNAQTAISAVNTAASGGAYINVGLTDIRPEDALYATYRTLKAYNSSGTGLGYNHGPSSKIGNSIISDVTAGLVATPVEFYMTGTDPIAAGAKIAPFATLPVGAAPVVYIMNNGGASAHPTDITDGGLSSSNPLASLLDGTTACTMANPAFDAGGGTAALTVFLREPLSGTMNTNEFSEIRTTNNPNDTQEKGVTSTTTAPYNPLHLGCPGGGFRNRAIGTGDVVTGVQTTANSIGYIFFGLGNASKLSGANYNYLTIDGVDPLAIPGTVNQQLPNCSVPNCTQAALWQGGLSYPHLRDGTYKDWSLYRWVGSPANPHFCADNSSTNPVAACVPVTYNTTEATCTAGTVEIHGTFSPEPTVGEQVTVAGYGSPNNYNGTFTITAVAATYVKYAETCGTVGHGTDSGASTVSVAPQTDAYGIQAIAQDTQNAVDFGVDDFVPFNPTGGTDGLNVYRSHQNAKATYANQNFPGNNGTLTQSGSNYTHGGGPEAGSDVGGCPEVGDSSTNGVLNCED